MTDIIAPFRLVKSLGTGSSGEVFLAERIDSFSQRVAIKVQAAPPGTADPAHEAQMLVALDHPYIVKLLDRGVLPDGRPYLVMEYVDGEPIDAYCARVGLSTPARVRLLIQVLEALSFSHRHLIVHADLKPSNILVTRQGTPKLLDFGVAQREGMAGPDGHTPVFASPEQLRAARLTAASDVYSMGVIANQLLAARGRDLAAIIESATRPEPDERYASVDTFKADLNHFLEGRDITVRPPSRWGATRWLKRHTMAAVAGLIVACTIVLAMAAVIRSAAQAAEQRARTQRELRELVALTGTLQGELYDSVGPLPQGHSAREVLLQGAADTLAMLAARDTGDSRLTLQLAQQYAILSRLHAADENASGAAAAKRTALSDLDRGKKLLERIPRYDYEFGAAQDELDAMHRARAALTL